MASRSPAKTASTVAKFLGTYGEVWNRYFPDLARRAHWHILHDLRFEEELVFADIAGNVFKEFGLDRNTCLARLRELRDRNLVEFSGERLHLSDAVVPTSLLVTTYDSHVVEAANAILATAHELEHISSYNVIYEHYDELNIVFRQFMAGFQTLWTTHLNEYLKRQHPKELALRRKILRDLRTAPYWYILFAAWYHGNNEHMDRKPYLLVDDFHLILYPKLGGNYQVDVANLGTI